MAHTELSVQLVAQTLPSQRYPSPQGWVAGGLHVPEPSQVLAPPLMIAPVQDSGTLHAVPTAATWQAPDPSQSVVLPQVSPAGHKLVPRGVPPASMDVHVPGVAVHVWHSPLQATSQHTPWVQTVDPHSVFPPHACPFFFLHAPPKHPYPGAQVVLSFSVVQVVAQAPAVHR